MKKIKLELTQKEIKVIYIELIKREVEIERTLKLGKKALYPLSFEDLQACKDIHPISEKERSDLKEDLKLESANLKLIADLSTKLIKIEKSTFNLKRQKFIDNLLTN